MSLPVNTEIKEIKSALIVENAAIPAENPLEIPSDKNANKELEAINKEVEQLTLVPKKNDKNTAEANRAEVIVKNDCKNPLQYLMQCYETSSSDDDDDDDNDDEENTNQLLANKRSVAESYKECKVGGDSKLSKINFSDSDNESDDSDSDSDSSSGSSVAIFEESSTSSEDEDDIELTSITTAVHNNNNTSSSKGTGARKKETVIKAPGELDLDDLPPVPPLPLDLILQQCEMETFLHMGHIKGILGLLDDQNLVETLNNLANQKHYSNSDIQDEIKCIITNEVQQNLSTLPKIKSLIENHFQKPLGVIDEVYIQRKFKKCCSKYLLNKLSDVLKQITENDDLIAQITSQLNNVKKLQDISNLLKQLNSFYDPSDEIILIDNLGLLNKEEEECLIDNLKELFLNQILDYSESTKNELQFLINLTGILATTKNLKLLVDKLRLNDFCSGQLSFSNLIQKIIDINYGDIDDDEKNKDKFKALKESATLLFGQTKIILFKKIHQSVASFIKPTEIRKVAADNRLVVEVIGKNILISDVISQIEALLQKDDKIEEVRIIGSTIFADVDLKQAIWHGKNIVVLANALNVHKKIVWNVSGLDNLHIYKDNAGKDSNGHGLQGADGFPGESGGNVLVQSQIISNPEYLTIISNGGNGSAGQDGGYGRDGANGKGITTSDFDEHYPPAAKFSIDQRKLNVKKTVQFIRDHFDISTEWFKTERQGMLTIYDETYESNTINKIVAECEAYTEFRGNIYLVGKSSEGTEVTFSYERGGVTTNCQAFVLFKGSEGKPGGNGGEYGLGGSSGYPGEITIKHSAGSKIAQIANHGEHGSNGKGGFYGTHGTNGCDMAYLDYSVSQFFSDRWPKYYGRDEKSKLKLTYYDGNSDRRVRCPYKEARGSSYIYAQIDSRTVENQSQKTYSERVTTRQNSDRKSYAIAVRKKTVSLNVLANYSHLITDNLTNTLSSEINSNGSIKSLTLKSIQDNLKEKAIPKIDISIKRQFNHCPHNPQRIKNTITNTIIEGNKTENHFIENIRESSITDWISISNIEMTFTQIQKLFEILPKSSKELEIFYKKFGFHIHELLIGKYKINILNEITKRNFDTISSQKNIDKDFDLDNGRYLKETNIEILRNYFHPILGSIAQFLIIPFDKAAQEKISKFCTQELSIKSGFLKQVLRTFVLEVGGGIDVGKEVKYLYDKYDELFKKRNNGFTVFPESFEKLDSSCLQEQIFKEWCTHMKKKNPLSVSFREFLAAVFQLNLKIYIEQDGDFKLQNNHNAMSNTIVRILLRYDQFIPLIIDEDFLNLEAKRLTTDIVYSKILKTVESIDNKTDLEEFLRLFSFEQFRNSIKISETENHLDKIEELTFYNTELLYKVCEFFAPQDQREIKDRLQKIKFTTQRNFVRHLLNRFLCEGCHVSCHEIYQFINGILSSDINGRRECNTFTWIIASYLQNDWIKELVLINIENYFKKPIVQKNVFRNNLRDINNNILIIFNIKLADNLNTNLNLESIKDILYLLSKIPNETVNLETLQLSEWPFALKESYFKCKLKNMLKWTTSDLETASYYLRSIENSYGSSLTEYLVNIIQEKNKELSTELLIEILVNIHNQTWNLNKDDMEKLSSGTIINWMSFMKRKFADEGTHRSLEQLIELINSNANTSKGLSDKLTSIKDNINNMKSNDAIFIKQFNKLTESDITQLIQTKHPPWKTLVLINRAIEIKRGFCLRDTQKLTILSLITNDRSTLAQVNTGEGKSLIVVATAIIKVLNGEKVDIITSSSVLAKRDAIDNKDIYELFGMKVSHNCSENIENRKDAYSGNQVVYGDLSSFQRDYLLDKFYNKNILGDHNFQNVIVDEVDSMLLDKGNNMLYLSHDLPGFDKLESVYLFIWQTINRPVASMEDIILSLDRKAIKDAVLHQLYLIIKREDLKLDASISEQQRNILWNNLINLGILDNNGKLILRKYANKLVNLPSEFLPFKERLCFLLDECVEQDKSIHVPNELKSFVEQHLDAWINSAIAAFFMLPGQDYVVDVDRSGSSSDREPNITILDRDTGTDNANSQWDEALHQFLQIKHGCKLSLQSLKSVFISNVSYFKLYGRLYGLTGTLGSQRERNLLQEIHAVDFVTIPTAKSKQFREERPQVCNNKENWTDEILNSIKRYNQRAVLIICESINDVELIQKVFVKRNIKVQSYTRDYEQFDTTPVEAGKIIIATNLAGRGTDIKISDEVCKAGGLHVCLAYLPNNVRIEEQAFGRAARCGEPGSGQLIILNNKEQCTGIIQLKKERDSGELYRLSEIKSHYESRITTEEYCFKAFKDRYEQLKKLLEENEIPIAAKDIMLQAVLDKWTFWLDKSSNNIQKICDEQSKKGFYSELNKFIDSLKFKLTVDDHSSWLTWVEGNSTQMIKLGKYLFEIKKFDHASTLFDRVIEMDTVFSEAAYYYKALVTASDLKKFKSNLQKSSKMFEERCRSAMNGAGMVGKIKKTNTKSILQIEAYENQQKQLAGIFGIFSQSIDDIFGRRMTDESFINQDITEDFAKELYEKFLENGILAKDKFAALDSDIKPQTLKTLSSNYGIPYENLRNFVSRYQNQSINPDLFQSVLKKEIILPSREAFWKELIAKNILVKETQIVVINKEKLPQTVKTLLDNGKLINLKVDNLDGNMTLYYERGMSETECYLFDKIIFKELIGKDQYKLFKKKNVLYVNKIADLSIKKAESLHFGCFDSICIEDFTKRLTIPNKDAQDIIQHLIKLDILVNEKQFYKLNKEYEHIEEITLTPFPIYESTVKMLLRTTFAYRIAFQKIQRQLNYNEQNTSYQINLLSKPHRNLFFDLVEEQIIIPSQVAAKLKNQEKIVEEIVEWRSGLSDSRKKDATKYVCRILDESRSLLLSLDVPNPKLKSLTEYSTKGNFGSYAEMSIFSLNALDHILVLEEKKWTWKMLLNTTAVVVMGITQIAIGLAIELYSVGLMTHVGSAFINEGIGDLFFATSAMMSGYFSWKDYAKHKKQSLLLTAATAGIGAYFSRGVKHSKFGYKLAGPNFEYGKKVAQMSGSELIKTVGPKVIAKEAAKRLTIKAIEGVAIGMANSGIDVLIERQIQNMCQSVLSDILTKIHDAIESNLSNNLEASFRLLGQKKARKMIDDLTKSAMSDKNILEEYLPLLSKITSCIMQGIAGAVQKRNTTANKWEVPIRAISTTIVWVERTTHLAQIPFITSSFLNKLDNKINERLQDTRKSNAKQEENLEINMEDFRKFREEISTQWQALMREKVSQIVTQHIISPVLKNGANCLIRLVGKSIKKAYRTCQESELFDKFEERKLKYQEDLKKSDEQKNDGSSSTCTKEKITEEYHRDLIELMKQSRNPELLGAIIRENIPMPLIGVDACARIIPLITGIKNLKIVIEGDGFRQEFSCVDPESNSGIQEGTKPTEVVINLQLKNNHFQVCDQSGNSSNDPSLNNCLYDALVLALPELEFVSPEEFRNLVADYVEQDPSIRYYIEQGWHRLPTNLGAIGGAANRRSSRSVRDLESTPNDDELLFDTNNTNNKKRNVKKVSAHLRDRFIRFARLIGTLQRISEQTKIDRDTVVQPGASKIQDQTSGLGREKIHASHVLRLGQINEVLINTPEFKELYNELHNLLGHTQNVPKYANEFHGIGGDFDKIQSNCLKKFNSINFGKSLTTEDAAIITEFKNECIEALNKRINSDKLNYSEKSELRHVKNYLNKIDTDYIYKKGQEGYLGKYKGPYI